MRAIGGILIVAAIISFVFELTSPGFLPSIGDPLVTSVIALGVGLVLVWMDERDRQRRRWKGIGKTPKYHD